MSDRETTIADFHERVNMTAHELERWLKTDESRDVGWTSGDGQESVGHHSGRTIVAILQKKPSEYSDADVAHMAKVVGYIKRHSAQGGPRKDKLHSRWAYSLKNWGHDPAKDAKRHAPKGAAWKSVSTAS